MKKSNFDELHKLKDSEFTELAESVSFSNKKEFNKDKDGDELKNIEKKQKVDKSLSKYLVAATNFTYILISPLILLLILYYFLTKYVLYKSSVILLILFIILGIISGYWSLFKEIRGGKK
ncbi:AtpZ/AtpI family protein [Caviibacter abscessus]|uniref:AtpZ/AtpI family protein n=1 Tax=Caviibacter abscessus TaxID=1766719 RepID=UPI00082F10FA|nr:AtpZ/AtpI family protein [Caviibacter abscessus]